MNLSDPAIFLYPVFCFCWPESTSTGAVLSPSWRQNPALTKMPQGIGADWERDWEERRIFNRTAGEQGWECRDEEGVGNKQELGKTRSPRRQKHLSGRSLYKLAQMQERNREIQAFMTISVTHYTIVTTFKNILPTSYSENYCFTTKPQPCKSSWYIIHVRAGFCLFFSLADLPRILQGDPFIRSKAKLCFSLSPWTESSHQVPAFGAALQPACVQGPVLPHSRQLSVSDKLQLPSSARVQY